ncbi:hypothetical protein P8452_68896 [Trifolium repens]|jgi:hypothetical protein|nr:hypothetical protein QL285_042325 [Trifolium repens]WJX86609.1 hypothetical protein P8452_68896 [Trifolium repens]
MTNCCIRYIAAFVLVAPIVIIPNDVARVLYFAFILVLWHNCINPDRSEIEENERRQELQPITRSVWSMREPYRPNSQVNTSFGTIAEIARLAIRALLLLKVLMVKKLWNVLFAWKSSAKES